MACAWEPLVHERVVGKIDPWLPIWKGVIRMKSQGEGSSNSDIGYCELTNESAGPATALVSA